MGTTENNNITRVLFCVDHFPASQKYTQEYLKDYPYIQVDKVSHGEVPNVIDKYHMCVPLVRPLDAGIIARAREMKLILQFGVGVDVIDIEAATQHGIKVAKIPGHMTGNSASCSEMAIYLMLSLLRKQRELEDAVKQKRVGEPVGETLSGKTVYIMGYGDIGFDLAKRLRAFDVKILASKRSWSYISNKPNGDDADCLLYEKGSHKKIYEFAAQADIVATCLSLNLETAGIVNEKFLSSMKKGAYLVNVARGGLLDYKSIYEHLESGHLGGLGIDAAWYEPFDPQDPILKFQNVIITPHVAGVTKHSFQTMAKVVGDCALRLHSGQPLNGVDILN